MTQFPDAQSNPAGRADLVLLTLSGYALGLALCFWPWKILTVLTVLVIVAACIIVLGVLWLMWPNKNGGTIVDKIIMSAIFFLFVWVFVFPLMKQEEELTQRLRQD